MILPKSKYKHVYARISRGRYIIWQANCVRIIDGKRHQIRKGFQVKEGLDAEREAALAIDKFLIILKLEPVNILKRK